MNRLATVNSILLPYILILAVAVLRLTVSHPYNFVPVFALSHGGKRFQLIFVETYQARSLSVGPADETVIWTLEAAGANPPSGCSLVVLLARSEERRAGKKG